MILRRSLHTSFILAYYKIVLFTLFFTEIKPEIGMRGMFTDFREKFLPVFYPCLYFLYIKACPSAQNRNLIFMGD